MIYLFQEYKTLLLTTISAYLFSQAYILMKSSQISYSQKVMIALRKFSVIESKFSKYIHLWHYVGMFFNSIVHLFWFNMK